MDVAKKIREHNKKIKKEDGPPARENRRHARQAAIWSVVIAFANLPTITAVTENISNSGLLLKTSKNIPVGTKAHIRVKTFVAGKSYIIDAIVIFRHVSLAGQDYRCGVEFIKLNSGSDVFIERYVKRVNPHLSELTETGEIQ